MDTNGHSDDIRILNVEIEKLRARIKELEFSNIRQDDNPGSTRDKGSQNDFNLLSAIDGFFMFDENGVILDANHALCDMLGYKKTELVGLNIRAIEAIETSEETSSHLKKIMEVGSDRFETKNRRKDGIAIQVEVSVGCLQSDNGRRFYGITRDISELKNTEEAYRHLVENVNDVLFMVNTQEVITYVSPAIEHVLGYAPAELIGKKFEHLIFGEDLAGVRHAFGDVLKNQLKPDEYRVTTKSGEIRWVRTSSRPIIQNEKVIGIQGVLVDVTERRLAEIALKESESKYRAIVENMQDVFYRTDLDGNFVMSSPSGLSLLGYESFDQLIGLNVKDFYYNEEDRSPLMKALETNGYLNDFELKLKRRDGTPIYISATTHFYYGPNGERLGIEGICRDISERKLTEEALRDSEAKYRTVVENMQDVFYRADLAGNVLLVSPSITKMLGFDSVEQILGRNIATDFYAFSEDRIAFLEQLKANGSVNDYGVTLKKADGTNIFVSTNSHLYKDVNGQIAGVEGVLRDVTVRKNAEEALRKSEEFSRAVFEHSPLGVSVRSRTGKLLSYNKAWKEIFDKNDQDINKSMSRERQELRFDDGDEYLKEWQSKIKEIYEKGGYLHVPEVRLQFPRDDGYHWVSKHFYAIKDKEGKVERVVILTEDITEGKRAEEALQKSQERLQAIADVLPDLLLVLDEQGRYVEILSSTDNLLYAPRAELRGRLMREVLPAETADWFLNIVKKTISTASSQNFEYKLEISGEEKWFDGKTTVLKTKIDGENCVVWVARDITGKKQSEEALRQSEQRFHELFQNSLNCYVLCQIILDENNKPVDYTYLEINQAFEELVGKKADQIVGRRASDLFPDVENLDFIEKMGHVALSGEPMQFEHYSFALNRYFETATFCPRKGQFASTFFDITNRKAADKAIRDNEERYRAIWQNSPIGICLNDREGTYHYVNPTYCKIYGYTEDELVGQNLYDTILPPEHPSQKSKNFFRHFDNPERTYLGETTEFIRKNGESVFIQYSSDFVWIDGNPKFMVSFNVDITEKKRAELALSSSEEKYRLVVENAGEIIATIDYSGTYLFMNKAATHSLGEDLKVLIGKTLWDLFPQEYADRMIKNIRKVIETGNHLSLESAVPIRGELKLFRTTIQPIVGSDGKISSALIMTIDFTEQKKLELRDSVRLSLLQNLRRAKSIDECLAYGCKAIFDAQLFRRAVLTLHNDKREIINLGQIGLEEEIVSQAKNQQAPDIKLANKIVQKKYRISNSYFIPVEDGLFPDKTKRHIPQVRSFGDGEGIWKVGDELFVPVIGSDNKKYEGWLSTDTPFNGKRPSQEIIQYLEEVLDIVSKQVHQIQSFEDLMSKQRDLETKNIAFGEVLKSIEDQKTEIRQIIAANIIQVILPAFNKLVRKDGSVNQTYYKLLKKALPELVTSSAQQIQLYVGLSPRQREICDMIRNGASSKEIAAALSIDLATVQKHREHIRKKLGINNKNVNLEIFLKGF